MTHISFSTKFTLLLLAMMTMMSNVAVVTTLPLLSEAFKDVDNIAFLSRMMITLPSLAIALLAPFLGHLVYRFGKKNSAVVALLFFAFTGSAGLYLETIYEILASRFFFGISIAVLMIVSTSLIGDYFKNEARHKFMGMQSAFMSIGGIFFIVGGGLLSDINWRYPFGIYLVGLVIAFFVAKFLFEVKIDETKEEDELLNSNLIPIYFLAFLLMVIFYILPTQIPFLIINVFHASGTMTGSIIATAFVFNALGAISFTKLKKRFDFATIYLIGMGIIGVGFICIGFVSDVHYFFITSPIMGFGGGILMTNITAWMLSKAHHTKRVKSSSYLTSSLFMGQFFSPIVTYPIVQMIGIENFFESIGSFILIVLIMIVLLKKR
ncbi:MAG: MFS transporter [Arcobacteraceae bacterium]|nr:MFS transporter [Arcobacteraceae bacterium]